MSRHTDRAGFAMPSYRGPASVGKKMQFHADPETGVITSEKPSD